MRLKLLLTAIIMCSVQLLFAQQNTLTPEEQKDGWQLLFDGTSLKGWHIYNRQYLGNEWEVKDNAIHLTDRTKPVWGGAINDLITDDKFADFDLKLEWKVANNTNSGVMFWVQEDPNNIPPYFTGPEVQVLDDYGTDVSASRPKQRAGDLFNIIEGSVHNVNAVGQWNHIEIFCQDGLVKFYQNGMNTITTRVDDDNWRNLVKTGYGDKRPLLAVVKTGKIDLQDSGDEVWYRNIKIKDLSRNEETAATGNAQTSVPSPSVNLKPGTFTNDTGALKIYLTTRITDRQPKYNETGDWTLKVDGNGKVSGMISWLLTLKEDPGISLQRNNFRQKEQASGTYDKTTKKLSLIGYGPDSSEIYERFQMVLNEQDKLTGTDQVLAKTGTIYGTLSGTYRVLNRPRTVYVNSKSEPRLVGRWVSAVTPTQLPKILVGNVIEFYDDGVGFSKSRVNPDYSGQLRLFDWSTSGSTLYLTGNAVPFSLVNDQLKIGNTVFKKAAIDPLQGYQTIIPNATATGNWIVAAMVANGKIYHSSDNLIDPQNLFYDIHPLSEKRGEVVAFSLSPFSTQIAYDSLTFYQYGPLEDANQLNPLKRKVALDGLSKSFQTDYDCRFEDLTGVMRNEVETVYLMKVNKPIWEDLSALHKSYNAYYFRKILPPPGMHWEKCMHCLGTGKIDGGYKDVYDHTNQNGNEVYRKEAVQADCPDCDGQGGYYVDDESGNR